MRIGYPCINRSLSCSSNKTFRLKSYSEEHLVETVRNNLDCLLKILEFNVENALFFFRITSDLIPFASHPINTFNWQDYFRSDFEFIGKFILRNRIRISMHPDQFTLINSVKEEIFERSLLELKYHAKVLDLMKLDTSAKIQIHVGGAYGDKKKSIERFVTRYRTLDESILRRLVIENDDKLFDVDDCLEISAQTKIPVLFDFFHHTVNHRTFPGKNHFELIVKTWNRDSDGLPMVDYSSKKNSGRATSHADSINAEDFARFLRITEPFDIDVMLEIKDKERSAIQASKLAMTDLRICAFLEGR
ncbi:TPA: UV DNA damage repair endonuclease UvsE [Candidatus Bathyarchaeota archaeon]|nr:UV DNA damage repair endonuclease UvsE [Candidatus Bathyarchaeota archaeon]